MKSILYVGATLMIGASVYGFVDYKKTSHNKEFTNMYKEEKKGTPVVTTDNNITKPVIKKEIAATDKNEETISIKPIQDDEKITTKETTVIENSTADVKTKVKKKKRLDARIFSRAPLRDEEDIKLLEPPKAEVKKTEEKEQ